MMGRTHLAIGLLVALLLLPFVSADRAILFVLLVLAGAILPDIDHGGSMINNLLPITKVVPWFFAHRGFFHSVFPPLIIYGLTAWLGAAWVGVYIAIGYISHLASDACTHLGVNLLHPLSRFQIKGFMRTGGIAEFFVFILVVALDALVAVGRLVTFK
ncbi:MAG: metal-dependent hydrolase [Nanoarchaeota archaeon]